MPGIASGYMPCSRKALIYNDIKKGAVYNRVRTLTAA
jgi:hypothetical protein